MNVLSLQSQVSYGCVGNNAAVFPMQRLGLQVMQIPTVLYSNHPGYQAFQGKPHDTHSIEDHLKGLEDLGKLDEINCLLTGYLGTRQTAELVLETVRKIRAKRPDFFYFCDPVIGDDKSKIYVDQDLAEFVRTELVKEADYLAPNLFELEYISGRPQKNLDDCLMACDNLRVTGTKNILVSSFMDIKKTKPHLCNLIVSDKGAWKVCTPLLPLRAKGTGDCLSALFLAHILRNEKPETALELASASLHGVIAETARSDAEELRIVESQAEFLNPSFYFDAERVG